jgi:hypothetical protein
VAPSAGVRRAQPRAGTAAAATAATGTGTLAGAARAGRVAVPRQGQQIRRDNLIYVPRGRTHIYYNNVYYYPLTYYYRPYTFGYGPAGRGYFYFDLHYDSYVFYPRTYVRYSDYGTYGYPTGELRLRVRPREAQVFVDGYYAGTVDDVDGVFQSLRLEEGAYLIEIVLPGYTPLAFDVLIRPGEKVTYRGELVPEY